MGEELVALLEGQEPTIYDEIFRENLKSRRIILNQGIDDSLIEIVCLMIIKWNIEDRGLTDEERRKRKIYILINTNGGDSIMANVLADIFSSSKTPIVTIGLAKCASAGIYILAAGHERYCFSNTVILLHDGENGYVSSGNKGKDIQKFFDQLDAKSEEILLKNTKITKEFLDSNRDREYYMFADEAQELGIIDKIIGINCDIDEIL